MLKYVIEIHGNICNLSGTSTLETGGAGTVYVELSNSSGAILHRKIYVDNNGHPYPRGSDLTQGSLRNLLNGSYNDISKIGGVTWLYHNDTEYFFNTMTISGNAHVAILSNTSSQDINIKGIKLYGDRSGVLHCGRRQRYGFEDIDIYMPVNIMAYRSDQFFLSHLTEHSIQWSKSFAYFEYTVLKPV